MHELLSLGVDLGGTKTEAALLRRSAADEGRFEVLERERAPTPAAEGYDAIVSATAELVRRVAARASLELAALPVGVGMPGAVTRRTGVVKNSNTVCLNGRPFREDLSRAIGRSIAFENDANCFALAEARLGAARAQRDGLIFGAILGTGVGGGLVFGGRAWDGPQKLGGEWGHHAVGPWTSRTARVEIDREGELGLGLGLRERCYCGNTGCLELYLSGKAVERDYQRRGGAALPLASIAGRRASDPLASAAIHEMLEAFGRGLANLIDILDPSAIVLGGGVSNLDLLYSEGVERVRAYVFNDELLTPIVRHELGDSAGVLGAALLPAP
jgi:fructokinase